MRKIFFLLLLIALSSGLMGYNNYVPDNIIVMLHENVRGDGIMSFITLHEQYGFHLEKILSERLNIMLFSFKWKNDWC